MPHRLPNIVMLVNDHQAYYRHGWDGGVRPLTPNFDRLASQGVLFQRAYAAAPLCGPARRTLLTGLYPHNHRNYHNYTDAPYEHELYLQLLAQAGYRNFYFGKWHAGPGTALDFGCQGFSDTDYGNPYITPTYHQYLQRHNLPPAEHLVERIFWNETFASMFPDLQEGARYRCRQAWCGEHAVGLTLTPKETHESFFLANLACQALTELAANPAAGPFHLRVDFWGPHQPHFPTPQFADLYNPADIPEYGSFRDDLRLKPDLYFEDSNRPLADENQRFRIPSPLPWSEWQKIIARAYAHITMVDAAGGLILEALERLGLAQNTLVIWTADHGDALASHGGRFDKGSYMTEEVIRVPLAMRYPGVIPPGSRSAALVCSTDLPPTVLQAAGIQFQTPVDGRSLLSLARGQADPKRADIMVETYGHGYGRYHVGRALLTERYKYCTYRGQLDELYDLQQDPYELNNLIHSPLHQDLLQQLRERLAAWQERTTDPGLDDPFFQESLAGESQRLQALAERRREKVRRARQSTPPH